MYQGNAMFNGKKHIYQTISFIKNGAQAQIMKAIELESGQNYAIKIYKKKSTKKKAFKTSRAVKIEK